VKLAVTIVSPPGYPHSEAFREVGETLLAALLALGHDAVLTTDLSLPGRRHIVLGSNLLPALRVRPEPGTILYNLEQVQAGSSWMRPELLELFRQFPVWDYSARNIDRWVELGVPRPRCVPIGTVPEMTRIASRPEEIDVLFYGSINERRKKIIDALRARGVRAEAVFGVYGAARDQLISASRLILNVHYYEAKVFEIVRVSYLLANRRAVVSERGADPEEEAEFEAGVAFADHAELVDRCVDLLARPDERVRLAQEGHAIMSRRSAIAYLREALSALAPGGGP
jgi:hypothetical protein